MARKVSEASDEEKGGKHGIIIFTVLLGCVLYSYLYYKGYSVMDIIPKYAFVNDVGVSLIVKDIRGEEPYMTFKAKCLYEDVKDYGDRWQTLMEDQGCQTDLFDRCLSNRTVPNRRETHVLNFVRRPDIDYCTCLDLNGWCQGEKCGDVKVKCCLDTGPKSVLCRVFN